MDILFQREEEQDRAVSVISISSGSARISVSSDSSSQESSLPDYESDLHIEELASEGSSSHDEASEDVPVGEVTSSNWWPTLFAAIRTPGDNSREPRANVYGQCPICYESLSIAGLKVPLEDDGSDPQPQPASLFGCGHVLCRPCADRLRNPPLPGEGEVWADITCVVCRRQLECGKRGWGCGKLCSVWEIPGQHESPQLLRDEVPQTAADGDEWFGPFCKRCDARKLFIRHFEDNDSWPDFLRNVGKSFIEFIFDSIEQMEDDGRPMDRPELVRMFQVAIDRHCYPLLDYRFDYIYDALDAMRVEGSHPWWT